MLASIVLTVACLLAGWGSTTSTAPPPSPAGSPAQVDASAPTITASPTTTAPSPSEDVAELRAVLDSIVIQ